MKYILALIILCCVTIAYADNWPREILSSEGTITMYQPQIDSYSGNSLKARAAVSILPTGKNETVYGAIWFDCKVFTDRPTRTVTIEEMEVRRIKFPSQTDADTAQIASALEEMIPRFDLSFSLDLLLLSVETAKKEKDSAHELDMKAPKIIVSNRPAILVRIDGEPIIADVAGSKFKQVINTPYFIVQNPANRKFFLHGGDSWFSTFTINGKWQHIISPPNSVIKLYNKMKFDEDIDENAIKDNLYFDKNIIPEIIVCTEPTALISFKGKLQLSRIQGTNLSFVINSPNRLFLDKETQYYYILTSGRWYTARKINGPWVYIASNRLPDDFKKIPPGSECDDVLAHIAGTIPAKEAIFDSQIPQMAEVDRSLTTDVVYDEDPQFESIENTGMDYAVNTSSAVIRINGQYYDCDEGIWFHSISPFGPWQVCTEIPDIIYTIPPRCPIYNVRYVRIYNYTRETVFFGYTAGYTGCYIYNGTIIYGTGYNYRPWHKNVYYPRPWTWGFNVHYNPWTGWYVNPGWSSPHGWFIHQPKGYNTGWWGPGNYQPAYYTFNQPVYRNGYIPNHRPELSGPANNDELNNVRRTSGSRRTATLYDNRGTSIRRPITGEISNIGNRATREQSQSTVSVPSPAAVSSTTSPQQEAARPARETNRSASQAESSRQIRETTRATPSTTQTESSRSTREATRTNPQPVPEPVPVPKPAAPAIPERATRTIAQPEQRIVTRPSTRENNVYAAPDGSILRNTPQGWQQREQNSWKNAPEAPSRQAAVHDSEVRQRAAERTTPVVQPTPPAAPKKDDNKDVRKR